MVWKAGFQNTAFECLTQTRLKLEKRESRKKGKKERYQEGRKEGISKFPPVL